MTQMGKIIVVEGIWRKIGMIKLVIYRLGLIR